MNRRDAMNAEKKRACLSALIASLRFTWRIVWLRRYRAASSALKESVSVVTARCWVPCAFLALLLWVPSLPAAVPEQFSVWGTAGPEFPAVPAGWSEEPGGPGGLPPVLPTPAEQRSGCVLFARDPLSIVGADSKPAPAERVKVIHTFAARGEYEPLALAIHALEPLDEVKVTAYELRAADGSVIPAGQLDLRVMRSVRVVVNAAAKTYRWEPFLLEKRAAFAVPKGKSALVWLTIKVPEEAPAGDYQGTLSVQAAGREPAAVQVQLKVLAFALPPAPVEMVLYYPRPAEADGLLTQELVDLREHGINSPIPAMEVRVKSRDRKFGEDDVAETQAHCRRLLGALKKVYGEWRFPLTFEVGHQIAYAWDPAKNWFAHWPHSPGLEADFARAIQVVAEVARANGSPKLRAYVIDEAGAHQLLDEAVYLNRLVKEKFPQIDTSTSIGGGIALGFDEIGQLVPVVDFLDSNRFTPEIAKALAGRGKPFGIYNGAGPTPAGARFFFGFYGWKTGAERIGQWVYNFGDSIFSGNGFRQEDEGYAYHAKDGPLPSLMSEAVREGIDDYRYTHLLWQTVAAANSSGQADAREAAAEAERVLTNLLARIGWGVQALQSSDRTPPPPPSTLRKWRWEIARQILALQSLPRAIPVATKASASRPSPLALAWAEPEKEEVRFGPEILPASDFENTMKPWRVEAWNGKGQGTLDAAERHGGRQSARIDVPAGSGNSAVTVLVWPQYGDGKLNLSLEGDRTYELSAWVKLKDRATLPELRVNVPAGAVASTRTGKSDPTPEGWQRIWLRTGLKVPAQPTYLAAWVQGPGTVWLDDLSLREVIPPPLKLSLDQASYDDLDKVGVATVSVARGVAPAQVVFSLASESGKTIATLTAPFQTQHMVNSENGMLTLVAPAMLSSMRFVFDPATLAPGNYIATVELRGLLNAPAATKSVQFRRVPSFK